jgi:hypothetical protein
MKGVLVGIIKVVITMSILLNVINTNDIKGCNCVEVPSDNRFAISRAPDEVHHLFETYEEGVDTKGIQERLHWLAVFLKGNPDFEGFIVSYAGQQACPGEAAARAKIAKQYLTSQERLLSSRLKTVDAGYRMKWVVELWYGPTRANGYPPARDTIDRTAVQIVRKCPRISPLRKPKPRSGLRFAILNQWPWPSGRQHKQ